MEELDLLQRVANRDMKAIIGDDGLPVVLPTIGQLVGRLRIEAELGSGGVGTVFKAIDPDAETIRAVKIPFPDSSRRDLERFKMEAKICANLDHQNIVRVYNIGQLKGVLPYAEMDYVPGKNLREYLKEQPLPIPVGLAVVAVLCQVLEYIHSQTFSIDGKTYDKLIHRDIKPSNIIISDKGIVKILDFGLAKFEGVELNNTITGALPGTPAYMAPEQHQKPIANVKTDLFSIGVTFYESITGIRPFPEEGEDSFARMIAAKNSGQFKFPSLIVKNVPPKVDEIIQRCLHPEPSKRYPTYAPLRMAAITLLDEYVKVPPDSIVKMYFSNRKGYFAAIPDKIARNKLRITKPLLIGILALVVIIPAIIFLSRDPFGKKQGENQIPLSVPVLSKNDDTRNKSHSEPAVNSSVDSLKQNILSVDSASIATMGNKSALTAKNGIGQHEVKVIVDNSKNNSPLKDAVSKFKEADYKGAIVILSRIDIDNLKAIQRDSVVLMIMESHYRVDEYNDGLVYGLEHETSDAKYHLLMALFYEVASMKDQAEASFTKAMTSPAKFDPSIRPKVYLFRARFYQRQFESTHDEQIRDKMIYAWKDFLYNGCVRQSPECDEAKRIVGGN